jgi:hypothetical protein
MIFSNPSERFSVSVGPCRETTGSDMDNFDESGGVVLARKLTRTAHAVNDIVNLKARPLCASSVFA